MTRALAIQMGVGAMAGMAGTTLLVRARRAASEPARYAQGIFGTMALIFGLGLIGFALVFSMASAT